MFVVDLITGGLTSPTHFNNVITAEIKKDHQNTNILGN